MHSDEEYDLTDDERAALAALPREMDPSAMLEGRVVRALRSEGHFGAAQGRGRITSVAWKVAAAATLFAGGVATGRYLLAADVARSASVSAPASRILGNDTSRPVGEPRPVRRSETVVAQTEMWL
ncbi:MAG: hypothetical protein ABI681_04375 [Gemmatimonadales bacterium]